MNPHKNNKESRVIIDESHTYDSDKDKKRQTLFLKDSGSNDNFLAFVTTIKTIENPSLIDEKLDLRLSSRLFMDTYQKHFNITNGINETILLVPKDNNSLYLVGKLNSMPNGIHALLFYAFEGRNIQFTKLITFNDAGIPIAHKDMQYHIKGSEDGLAQEGKTTCQINSDNTMNYIVYVEKEGKKEMIIKSETMYQIQENGTIKEVIAEVGSVDLEAEINTDTYKDNKEQVIIIDESDIYNSSKKRQTLFLKNGASEGDFSAFISTVKTIENPSLIDEKSDLNLSSRLFMDTYQKHFNITNGINETLLLIPKDDNSLYLVGKLDSMPNGIHALLFYACKGRNIQFSKLITFDDTGIPIAHKNIQYHIKGTEDGFEKEGKTTCYLNSNQTISCINYTESEEKRTPKSEKIYQIQEDGSIEEVRIVDLEGKINEKEDDK